MAVGMHGERVSLVYNPLVERNRFRILSSYHEKGRLHLVLLQNIKHLSGLYTWTVIKSQIHMMLAVFGNGPCQRSRIGRLHDHRTVLFVLADRTLPASLPAFSDFLRL